MSPELVPFNHLGIVGSPYEADVRAAIDRVVASGWFILGPEVEAFEKEMARELGFGHAIAVGNGTDAISLSLLALGVRPGDEVLTSPLTAAFTALAVSRIGACPVFADVEADTLQISTEDVRRRITERTRAVIPVHLYGNACDIEPLVAVAREHGLVVVEDACQAHGARYGERSLGCFGDAGAFSFYPTKNLGALGDGGLVVTEDEDVAARLRRIRNGGQSSRYRHEEVGFNSRLDELQAAVLRAKLPHLQAGNEKRRELSALYEAGLRGARIETVAVRDGCLSARHLFVVRTSERDPLAEHLKRKGIQTLVHYPVPTHLQPAYVHLGQGEGSCPRAEDACREILSLPLHPALPRESVERVVDAVREFCGA